MRALCIRHDARVHWQSVFLESSLPAILLLSTVATWLLPLTNGLARDQEGRFLWSLGYP